MIVMPIRVLAPSPPEAGPCTTCTHAAKPHWFGEPGGCEVAGCDCTTYRPVPA